MKWNIFCFAFGRIKKHLIKKSSLEMAVQTSCAKWRYTIFVIVHVKQTHTTVKCEDDDVLKR